MRVFFAVPIDANTCLEIATWRDRSFPGQGRPVPMANFHITLAFIGNVSMPKLEHLCLSVDKLMEKQQLTGGSMELDEAGYWHKHGIFWLGPKSWPRQLTQLASKLKSLGTRVGAKRDKKPFQPHMTLLRHCDIAHSAPSVIPAFRVDYTQFARFDSRQGKQGFSYHALQYWDLITQSGP